MKLLCAVLLIFSLIFSGCVKEPQAAESSREKLIVVNSEATTLEGRFAVPVGYERVPIEKKSFAQYLRSLSLKPQGTKVKYYNGETKNRDVYEAVINLDIGNRDLQQCADAVIRLRAEYLFQEKKYAEIHFNFTNGFTAEYPKWRDGYRVVVQGNSAKWIKTAAYSTEYRDFRKYLDTVFAYAGTLSLAKELDPVESEDMQIGDIFIQGGSPGHCVIVVDMAQNTRTGEKLFMLAQSYMPAQDIQILKNPQKNDLSPWYSLDLGTVLNTPEWTFASKDLRRFE